MYLEYKTLGTFLKAKHVRIIKSIYHKLFQIFHSLAETKYMKL